MQARYDLRMTRRCRLERALGTELIVGQSMWTHRFPAWLTGLVERWDLEEPGQSLPASSAPALKWTPWDILESLGSTEDQKKPYSPAFMLQPGIGFPVSSTSPLPVCQVTSFCIHLPHLPTPQKYSPLLSHLSLELEWVLMMALAFNSVNQPLSLIIHSQCLFKYCQQ